MNKYILILIILALFSCHKNSGNGNCPDINVLTPAPNQQFNGAQTILVEASVSHTDAIHEVKLRVRNDANGNEILEYNVDVNANSYNLSRTFAAQQGITYKIEVEASDFDGNECEKEFRIVVN